MVDDFFSSQFSLDPSTSEFEQSIRKKGGHSSPRTDLDKFHPPHSLPIHHPPSASVDLGPRHPPELRQVLTMHLLDS
ncbi:hypothetical protein PGTUg99_014436 [Puccinia graminis f. sp. tritici]|uniref:Uncharacterized protein n=1 Tax=Puccinia graminis f. sp. tritici TaxID=56615 RepID=A0A5B0RUL9_PUCGR|nr:hypothetical protein PGTUg99_014436 [Puccinia graminis f. sp. tritici]